MIDGNSPKSKKSADFLKSGVSIRVLSAVMLLAAAITVAGTLMVCRQASHSAQSLYVLEENRQKCDAAIQQLMDGSDYLTDQIQQYVVRGERSYMDEYWTEVNVTQSRDAALNAILALDITQQEREAATAGKEESDALIQGEIWAMRLVSESIGIPESDMPAPVAAFRLNAANSALSAQQKRSAAISYVFGPEYSTSKNTIRSQVNQFRTEVLNSYNQRTMTALENTKITSVMMAVEIIIFVLIFIGVGAYFAHQVVSPLIGFSRELNKYEEGEHFRLKECGAVEIRQFARAFDDLSDKVDRHTHRLERLGYVDYLTDVPNRASITEYVEKIIADDISPLGVMIVDIDNFKHFNDTYGHAMGDKVLQHVAKAVCSVQSEDKGVCGRLCGEEFVVVSPGADEVYLQETARKILQNVRDISGQDVGLPEEKNFRITVSAGGMLWRGDTPADFILLLSRADKALYASKLNGKDRYTFQMP